MARRGDEASYEVLGLIGRGGMAEVYLVRHGEVLRALKVLHLSDPRLWERLEREGRLQARIEHPNVLPVLDEVEFLGRPALLLPYVQGPSLDRLLSEGRLTSEQAQALFGGVVAGVAAIHQARLVHRDLKPGNVLLDPSSGVGVPRVSDFGLARALHSEGRLTRTGVGMGTPLYAAPEQLHDAAHVDARADVWALGALLVELLAGRGPADEPFEHRLPRLPHPWAELAQHLLAREPGKRPADASEVAALLPPLPADRALSAELCRALTPTVLPVALPQAPGATLAPLTADSTLPVEPAQLPAERGDFIGRQDDLDALQEAMVAGARLVTVLGPAGVGKTRLALRWARSHRQDWPGGAWFVELTDARDVEDIVSAVARTLEVQLQPLDPVRQLGHALAGRGRCLVILDNFEQVAHHAEATLGRWMERAEQAQFVVTSRAVLGIPGEQLLALAPMQAPDAVALFLRRAQAARRGFAPDEQERHAIEQLVDLLDRLPLAIELAAARVRSMSARQVLAHMAERFALLTAPTGRHDRHATLKAALDWSWELLSPDDQLGLAQLSVFEGGFTHEAAQAVLRLPEGAACWAVLQALIDQSLVTSEASPDGSARMDLLVSVREYAASKLGAETEDTQRRHGLYFAQLGSSVPPLAELDNLAAATRRAIDRGDGPVAVGALEGAWSLLSPRGPVTTADALASGVLGMDGLSPSERGRALLVAGQVSETLGRADEARARLQGALALAREEGDRLLELQAHARIGWVWLSADPREAERWLASAISMARALGHRNEEARALANLAIVWSRQGRPEASAHFTEALALARQTRDRYTEIKVLVSTAILCFSQDRYEDSLSLLQQALHLARKAGTRRQELSSLSNLAALHHLRGTYEEAAALLREALRLARESGFRSEEGAAAGNLGEVCLDLLRYDEAVPLLELSASIHHEYGLGTIEGEMLANLGRAYHFQGRRDEAHACEVKASRLLGERQLDKTVACGLRRLALLRACLGDGQGATRLLDQVLEVLRSTLPFQSAVFSTSGELALALTARAELALDAQDPGLARALLAETRALAIPSEAIRADLARVEALLGEDRGGA